MEGNSIRTTERITAVHRDTILALLVMAGERCTKLMEEKLTPLKVIGRAGTHGNTGMFVVV
jgi:hypothetical protein